jgi:hypothetical protein
MPDTQRAVARLSACPRQPVEPTPNWLTPNAVCKRFSVPKCAKARCSQPGWRGAFGDCIGRDRRNIEDAPPRQLGALLRLGVESIRCTVGFGDMAVAPWFGARWPGRGDWAGFALTWTRASFVPPSKWRGAACASRNITEPSALGQQIAAPCGAEASRARPDSSLARATAGRHASLPPRARRRRPVAPWAVYAAARYPRGMAPSKRFVYSSRGAPRICSTLACSTTAPSFITITSSAMKRTTARSWLMKM